MSNPLFWPVAIVVAYVLLAGVAGLYMLRALRADPQAVEAPKYEMLRDSDDPREERQGG